VRRIAVIGPSADDPVALLGNYNGFSRQQVAPLEGLERQFAGKAKVVYTLGATYTPQSPALIPSQALTPPEGSGQGVLAEYFDNAEFQGAAKVSRVEPRPFLEASMAGPEVAAAFPRSGYWVRLSGTLRPPVSGDYSIAATLVERRGTVRLFLDDRELTGSGATDHALLQKGHAYRLRAEYRVQDPAGTVQIGWIPPAGPLLAEAIESVKQSDVAVAFVGLNPNLEGEEMPVSIPGFSGGDRTTLDLPESQEKLIEAAVSTGKPVVVVLASGSALAANYAAAHAAAMLELWYGGEEAGTAIAETLAGVNNPAGRLPVTFYRGVEELPPFADYSMNGRTYRYFKGEPLFGFGFGLSYSEFAYAGLRAERTATGARVAVRVENKSPREGDEVVQLYVSGASGPDAAIRQLRGFERIHLKPGETREIRFTLATEDLPKGKATISVGGGQPVGRIPHVEATI
jgi:beta-glucosidase